MEDYQELINAEVPKFFKGKASMKYHGENDRSLLRSETQDTFYSFNTFYHIEIGNIEQINHAQYQNSLKKLCYKIEKFDKPIVLENNGIQYNFEPDELIALGKPKLEHNQVEGNESFGHFSDVDIVFMTHRTEECIMHKQDYPTGKVIFGENGERDDEFYNQDGSTYWVNTPPKCIQSAPTGNREDEDTRYRLEYYNADCTTYWGKWIKKKNIETEKSKWPPDIENPLGCFGTLISIVIGVYILIQIIGFIWSGAWLILLIYPAIFLVVYGIIILLNFLSRFPALLSRVGLGISWLWSFFIFIVVFYGISAFFTDNNWSNDNYYPQITEADSKSTIETTDVPYKYDREDAVDFDKNDSEDTLSDKKINVKLDWKGLDGKNYDGSYFILESKMNSSSNNLNNAKSFGVSSYGSLYNKVSQFDKNLISSMYKMLNSIKLKNKQSEYEFASTIVSMVQSIEYVLIVDESCEKAKATWARDLNMDGVECEGNAPYGIKTPVEFLATLKGDCDTRTLLLYTIFKHYNYDVAIINSDVYAHSMLGLNIPGANGSYKRYGNKKYYFWETTSTGFNLGDLPRETGNINFWTIEIN